VSGLTRCRRLRSVVCGGSSPCGCQKGRSTAAIGGLFWSGCVEGKDVRLS
jgi:hypothetical protein